MNTFLARSAALSFSAAFLILAPDLHPAPPAGGSPAPKPYTLFMGADFDIQQHDSYYRVVDVSGSSFVIKVHGDQVRIPTETEKLNLKIQMSLKLTKAFVTVGNLQSDRAYTPANDPRRKWAASSSMGDTGGAQRQFLGAQSAVSQNQAQASNPSMPAAGRAAIAAQGPALQAAATAASDNFARANLEAGSDMNSAGYNSMQMEAELAKGLFDAVEVAFEVSSDTPLNTPYVMLVAQYHDPSTPPGAARNWIYAKALEPIDAKPRKIRILQGGFPPGFALEKLQVHLYNNGEELATNVADKRVALTRDEAFQYLMIEYLTSHKGANVPAVPAMATLPDDFRARLQDGQYGQTYFVKVSKDGLPMDAFVDQSCRKKVDDPYLQAVVRDIRFKPTLEQGRPVEGVALLRFSDLRL